MSELSEFAELEICMSHQCAWCPLQARCEAEEKREQKRERKKDDRRERKAIRKAKGYYDV